MFSGPRTCGPRFFIGKWYSEDMKKRLLIGAFVGLGIIIGAQWPEFFTRWINLVWLAVIVLSGLALRVKD